MIHPIPSGTRDVLPDEMRELRAITTAVSRVFGEAGYGEVATPLLEYEETLARGGRAGLEPAYRLFDEHGQTLVLRSDMTVPIARVAATRYAQAEPPLRFCYVASSYRAVRPQRGQPREFLQAGIELLGAPSPGGTAEALVVLCAALDAAGLQRYRVGLGDASIFPSLLAGLGVSDAAADGLLHELRTRDFAGLARKAAALDLPAGDADLLLGLPQRRGGPEVLADADGPAAGALAGLRALHELLPPVVAGRVIFDLGLVGHLDYYTGAVFEVYDPALGVPIGSGGRYDELLGRFGHPLPAVGFGLNVERLHIALAEEERGR